MEKQKVGIVFAACVVLLIWCLLHTPDGAEQREWSSTTGTITVSHVVSRRGSHGTYYETEYEYTYSVGKANYTGQESVADVGAYQPGSLPVGASVKVYYNQTNPRITSLRR